MQRSGRATLDDAALVDLMLSALPRLGRRISATLRDEGHPSMERLRALHRLRHGALRVTDVADAWRVSVPSVSRLLDALAEDGLVRRSGDAHDRRVVRVELTDKGATVLAAAETSAQRVADELLCSLSSDQRHRLAVALADLEVVLDQEPPQPARAGRG